VQKPEIETTDGGGIGRVGIIGDTRHFAWASRPTSGSPKVDPCVMSHDCQGVADVLTYDIKEVSCARDERDH
jgi:hypothetical protein